MPPSLASAISSIDAKLRDPGPTGMAIGFLFLWALFSFGTWFNCRSQTELILNELQREAELAVHTKANEIDGLLNRTIHTIRTVSLLKGVRSAAPANRNHEGEDVVKTGRISASDLAFVQHLFNDLSLSVGISKIYVIYDGFQPDRDQLPFLALGGSGIGPSQLNQAKPESSAAGESAVAQDPGDEYVEYLRQLAFFRRHHPTLSEQSAEHSPSVSSGLIRSSDTRQLDSGPSSDRRHESGVSIAVPIYDPSTRRFKGIVTAVLRSNTLEAALVGLPFIPAGLESGQQKQAASSVLQLRQPSSFLLENSVSGIQIYDRRNTHWASAPANRSIPAYEYQTKVEVSGQGDWMLHNYVSKATVDHKVEITRSNALVQFALLSFALALVWATLRSMMKQQLQATKRHLALASQLGQASDDHAKTRVKLQATLDTIADLFFEVGADGRYHDIYSRCADLLAMPADNYLGNTIAETLPQDVAKLWMEALKEATEHGVSTGKQYQLHLPQGDRWFELSVSRKTTLSSEESRFIVLAHDVTSRKLAEEGLRKREAFFRLISENVGDHIVVVDLIGRCVYTSPAYERFVRSSTDLLGSDAFAHVHPEDQDRVRKAFAATAKTGGSCEIEYRHVASGGHTYPIECHLAVIRNNREQIENVVLVSRDISERKAKDHEIENLAFYDSLTELPNRRLLLDRLRQALARLARTGSNGALMFLDLDNFKSRRPPRDS